MFMAENVSYGVRTRNIDNSYHFIKQHVEDDFIKIVIVNKDNNDLELFTKNVDKDT
jgi:hypothetical protein